MRNFGKKSLDEIKERLVARGLIEATEPSEGGTDGSDSDTDADTSDTDTSEDVTSDDTSSDDVETTGDDQMVAGEER
jgi:hypothetical protein